MVAGTTNEWAIDTMRGIWGICARIRAAQTGSTEYRMRHRAADVIRNCVVGRLCVDGYLPSYRTDTGAF